MNGHDRNISYIIFLLAALLGLPIPALAQSFVFGPQQVGTTSAETKVTTICCGGTETFTFSVTGDFKEL
jgi:hypothetical protein